MLGFFNLHLGLTLNSDKCDVMTFTRCREPIFHSYHLNDYTIRLTILYSSGYFSRGFWKFLPYLFKFWIPHQCYGFKGLQDIMFCSTQMHQYVFFVLFYVLRYYYLLWIYKYRRQIFMFLYLYFSIIKM